MIISVMTFNTQHCMNFKSGKIDYDIMAQTIKTQNADIVGLNEIRDKGDSSEYEPQAKILADMLGYHFYFAKATDVNGNNPYGNAILSKYPIVMSVTIPIPNPAAKVYGSFYEPRCILKSRIDIGGGIDVFVTHFGLNPDEILNAVSAVISNVSERKSILMGDFNISPTNDALNPIRSYLNDAAQCFDKELLSYPSDNPRVKIDYIFASKDIKIRSADILPIVASDHRPHVAVLDL